MQPLISGKIMNSIGDDLLGNNQHLQKMKLKKGKFKINQLHLQRTLLLFILLVTLRYSELGIQKLRDAALPTSLLPHFSTLSLAPKKQETKHLLRYFYALWEAVGMIKMINQRISHLSEPFIDKQGSVIISWCEMQVAITDIKLHRKITYFIKLKLQQ